MRLDAFLADEMTRTLPDARERFTRARVQKLIDDGRVRLDGKATKASARLRSGSIAEIDVPAPRVIAPQPEEIPLEVLHEDDDLIVIDKPAGLAAHAGAGRETGTLVNALLARCTTLSGIGDALRPGIVHRLDKDTTGVLVAAKTDLAHQSLSAQFAAHSIDRRYRALVWGAAPETLTVDARIARDPKDRVRFAAFPRESETGRRAVTHVTRQEAFGRAAALVECRLETGRTHQIRVHLTSRGLPLVGDRLYGPKHPPSGIPDVMRDAAHSVSRQMLHAQLLGFEHPRSAKRVTFTAPLPADMDAVLRAFRSAA